MSTIDEIATRFWRKVQRGPGCWVWTGALADNGYGNFNGGGKTLKPHRLSYELLVGPIPEGLVIDHLCRNRACVNPDHLEVVTQRENVLRGRSPAAHRARWTECPRGHAFDEINTYITPSGKRNCRTCRAAANARYLRRRAA